MQVSSPGNAIGISGVIPVPMDWPEQKVVLESEQKSDNVGKLKYSNPNKTSRQLKFKIKRLASGESAEAMVRFRVEKQKTVAPTDTKIWSVPKPVTDSLSKYLQPSPYIESDHERIRKIADDLKDESLTAWEQVEKILKWVREEIRYKFDVKIHSCLDALDRKQGDCEELSSLFIAICRAQGIPARAVWIPGHAYPEFYLADNQGNGRWFPCQAAGPYEFGTMTESRPILQKGDRVRLPGTNKTVRYLQPTLQAKHATGQIRIQWISRRISNADDSRRSSE